MSVMFSLRSAILILTVSFISVDSYFVTKSNETLIAEELVKSLGLSTNRPVHNQNTVVNVSVTFLVTRIIELNDVQQNLKVAGWYYLVWHDEFIRWNSSKYGVGCVRIPDDSIWKPDIILNNNIDEEYNQFQPDTPVRVCSDGSATYQTYAIFQSSCDISIKLFPFDNQTCYLRFSSWQYDQTELDLYAHSAFKRDQQGQFRDNGVWKLIKVESHREIVEYQSNIKPYVYSVVSIHIKRRHGFYLLFILIPYCFCSFLIFWMFFIPTESGEKISYGITAVLGMIVFQQIIALSLPPVGDESTTIGKLFTSVVCFGVISVFIEVMVNNIYMQGNIYKTYVCLLKWFQTKTDEQHAGETEETREPLQEQQHTLATSKNIIKLQGHCEKFDFFFGMFCLATLFVMMAVVYIYHLLSEYMSELAN